MNAPYNQRKQHWVTRFTQLKNYCHAKRFPRADAPKPATVTGPMMLVKTQVAVVGPGQKALRAARGELVCFFTSSSGGRSLARIPSSQPYKVVRGTVRGRMPIRMSCSLKGKSLRLDRTTITGSQLRGMRNPFIGLACTTTSCKVRFGPSRPG